nr:putative retrotransposon protein [Tanacetum cinerariifolium]
MFLVYGGNFDAELQVKCYCDAGFETDRDDTKSQTGYVFTLNGGAVVWKSSKQSTTAQHAVEAEYIAAAKAAKEAVWIRKFVDELGVVPSNNYHIEMNCDNTTAISMAKETGIMKGARHFQKKFHYVRECVETGKIEMVKVHTDDNLADPFTKALAGPKLTRHARSMGLRPASSFIDFIFETKDGAATIRDYMQTLAPQLKVESNGIDTFSLILNHEQKMNSNGNKIKYFFQTTMITKDMFKWKKENEENDEENQFESFSNTIKSEFIKDPEMINLKDLEMEFFPIIAHEHYYLVVFNFLKGHTVIIDNSETKMTYEAKYKTVCELLKKKEID